MTEKEFFDICCPCCTATAVLRGSMGPRGATGPQGPAGQTGPKGATGATGAASLTVFSRSRTARSGPKVSRSPWRSVWLTMERSLTVVPAVD